MVNSMCFRELIVIITCLISFAACSASSVPEEEAETRYVVVQKPARIPPGVVRYCWEEPMVVLEENGPGLDADGRWYRPSYVAVREVRQGRWRPCEPVKSEIKGETRNER